MLTSSERAAGATTLSTLLTARAAASGTERALTFLGPEGTTVTWAELDGRVTAVAAALRQVTEPGQRVAILVAHPVEQVVAFLGVLRAGLVAIPAGPDRARVFADAEPAIVLATSATVATTRRFLSTLDTCGHRVLAVDAVPAAPGFTEDPVPAEDVAYLQYPGGVMVTHANVVANARQAARVLGPGTLVSRLPLSDPLGLLLGVAVPLTTGRPAVLVERLEPLEALGPVTTLASTTDPELDRLREAVGQLRVCYRVPEATALVACGHPAGQRVAIVDPGGRRLPAGEAGEIWVSGPNVARGYWNRPEESSRVFCAILAGDDEPRWWLRTGDLGVLDEAGELSILDEDFAAGHHPRDLEATAGEAHPPIRDAAAFAVPGAQVVLVVELASGIVPPRGVVERAVRGALAERHGLTPRRVVVLSAGALPGNRAECRESYLAGLSTPDGLR